MYPTSALYKQAVRDNGREWRLRMTAYLYADGAYTGDTLVLHNEDIVQGSFSYNESAVCSDTLDIGVTYSNGIDFSLANGDGRFTQVNFAGARLFVEAGLLVDGDDEVWEDIPLGEFIVTDEGKKMSTVPIKALDRMYMLNADLLTAVNVLPNSTPYYILQLICEKFGVSAEHDTAARVNALSGFYGGEGPVFDDKTTCRDFIGYCAAALGQSARFNRKGFLEFFGISDTVYETDSGNRTSLTASDFTVCVTGAQVTAADGETYFEPRFESEDMPDPYVIEVAQNPLLINAELAVLAAHNALAGLTKADYRPYTCGLIGDPSIQCGDRVRHSVKDGRQAIDSIITNLTYKFRGAGQIEAKGKAPQVNNQKSGDAKKMTEVRNQIAQEMSSGFSSFEDSILGQTEILTKFMGFYPYQERDEDGKLVAFYLCDNPDHELAQLVWSFTLGGMAVSHNGIGGPFSSGWTKDDLIFARNITADMIAAGTLKALDSLLSIDLQNGKLTTRTSFGTAEMSGNDIRLNYLDAQGETISDMHLTAGDKPKDTDSRSVRMTVDLSSRGGDVRSYIEQSFEYGDGPDGKPVPVSTSPLTISSTEGVLLDKDFAVRDAILYDNIKMQRKFREPDNTGVDFILFPQVMNFDDALQESLSMDFQSKTEAGENRNVIRQNEMEA